MNSFAVGLIVSFVSILKRLVISWSIKQFGTNCRFLQMGRIVAFSKWDELTLGTNCRFLEFGTNCRLGRIVAQPKNCGLIISIDCRIGKFMLILIFCCSEAFVTPLAQMSREFGYRKSHTYFSL